MCAFVRHEGLQQFIAGLLFGGITVIGMMVPIRISPGVIFDARSVILIMAGLFGGPSVAIVQVSLLVPIVLAGRWRLSGWAGNDHDQRGAQAGLSLRLSAG